jgi:hypothetical protein
MISVWTALEEITASFIYGTSCATELRRHDVAVTDSGEDGMKFQRQFLLWFIACSSGGGLPSLYTETRSDISWSKNLDPHF